MEEIGLLRAENHHCTRHCTVNDNGSHLNHGHGPLQQHARPLTHSIGRPMTTLRRAPLALQLVALTWTSKLGASILRTRDEEGEHKGDTLGRAIASLHRYPPLATHATAM